MKKKAFDSLIVTISIILSGCNDCTKVVPVGCWRSNMGRPDITIEKEKDETFTIESVEYPRMFIFAWMVTIRREKMGILELSTVSSAQESMNSSTLLICRKYRLIKNKEYYG